jgi:hypothetical protein
MIKRAHAGHGSEDWQEARRKDIRDAAAKARRYRDSSPAEQLAIDIANLQERAGQIAAAARMMGDAGVAKELPAIGARVAELKAELASLNVSASQ